MKNESPASSSGPTAAGGAPLPFLQTLLSAVRPPEWVVSELQNRVVLFLNHVLMQEPAAQDRLRRQKGKAVRIQWGEIHLTLAPTAAGLLERAAPDVQPELRMTLTQTSPLALAQNLLAGAKPAVDIQGDVQLAAEVAWLVDNVRWDVEEDLSRLVGDATAHTLTGVARSTAAALKAFLARLPARFTPSAHASSAAPPAAGAATGNPGSHGEGGTAA
jgi:ubiquinone biosynthesis protein UbiJ